MKILDSLFQLSGYIKGLNSCLTENTRRIKELENRVKDINFEITAIEPRIEMGLRYLADEIKELRDYTKILSGRIAKLKGKDNEKKNNLTGQEDTNI